MEPLRAAVIDRVGTELVLRTKHGARIRIPKQKGLGLGDTCHILYDYTKMRVREIWTDEDLQEPQAAGELEELLPVEDEEELDIDTFPTYLNEEGRFS
jgi:hypothetical protein